MKNDTTARMIARCTDPSSIISSRAITMIAADRVSAAGKMSNTSLRHEPQRPSLSPAQLRSPSLDDRPRQWVNSHRAGYVMHMTDVPSPPPMRPMPEPGPVPMPEPIPQPRPEPAIPQPEPTPLEPPPQPPIPTA